jgi:hypothetical protein
MSAKSFIRRFLFSDSELRAISSWAAFVEPENHLFIQGDDPWNPEIPDEHDLSWGCAPKLGWIQGLSISGKTLQINHFAVEKSLTGLGLGSRLAHSLGQSVKAHAGINSLLFTEYTQTAAHDSFFTSRLGATKQPCHFDHKRYEWVWLIP